MTWRATPEVGRWYNMTQRCHNPKATDFAYYGACGIEVCNRWRFGEDGKSGAECFFEDMGRCPNRHLTLDRIDNDRGYFEANCRWAPWSVQANNRREPSRTAFERAGVEFNADGLGVRLNPAKGRRPT